MQAKRFCVIYGIFLLHISAALTCSVTGKIQMDRDAHDNLFAVLALQNENTQATNIFALVKPIGEHWSSLAEISDTKGNCMDPIIEVSENGNTVALWLVTMENGNNGLMVAVLESVSAKWATPIVITDSAENVVNNWYNIAITSDGVVAIWSSLIEDKKAESLVRVLRTASARFGGEWSAPETIS